MKRTTRAVSEMKPRDQNPSADPDVRQSRPFALFSLTHIIIAVGIDEIAPIQHSVVKRDNKRLCGCNVRSERHVMNVAKAEKV